MRRCAASVSCTRRSHCAYRIRYGDRGTFLGFTIQTVIFYIRVYIGVPLFRETTVCQCTESHCYRKTTDHVLKIVGAASRGDFAGGYQFDVQLLNEQNDL